MVTVIDLQQAEDPQDIVHRAVQAIAEGCVVGIPTDTVYSLAAGALDPTAVQRLVTLAEKEGGVHPVIAVHSAHVAWDYVCDASPLAQRLARRCWPGPVTLVLPCGDVDSAISHLPSGVQEFVFQSEKEVGFRVVNHRVIQQLHQFLSAPLLIVGSTRNGKPAASTGKEIADQFGEQISLVLDDGPCRYGVPSSVVRVVGNRYEILREGVIERAAMRQFAKPIVAVVCTGNTCRSPMGEALLRDHFFRKTGMEDTVQVVSAGIAAMAGSGASPQAIEVMGQRKLDLTGHSSRPLDERVVHLADFILTMTRGHRDAILSRWPQFADRVRTLRHDGGDISDPVGAPREIYAACADQIDIELRQWVDGLGDQWLPHELSIEGGEHVAS